MSENFSNKSDNAPIEKITGVCSYCLPRGDRKEKEVFQCKHCSDYFCEEHIEARLPKLAPFKSTDIDRQIEWEKKDGHPCASYVDYVIKKEEDIKIKIDNINSAKEVHVEITKPEIKYETKYESEPEIKSESEVPKGESIEVIKDKPNDVIKKEPIKTREINSDKTEVNKHKNFLLSINSVDKKIQVNIILLLAIIVLVVCIYVFGGVPATFLSIFNVSLLALILLRYLPGNIRMILLTTMICLVLITSLYILAGSVINWALIGIDAAAVAVYITVKVGLETPSSKSSYHRRKIRDYRSEELSEEDDDDDTYEEGVFYKKKKSPSRFSRGATSRELIGKPRQRDLVGSKYSNLTLKDYVGNNKKKKRRYY